MSYEELIPTEIALAEQAYLYRQLCTDTYFGPTLTADLRGAGQGRAREKCQSLLAAVEREFARHIKGQPEMVHIPLLSLVLNEHALLEGLPGVGKTEIIKWIAHVTGLPFQRVQFIPDMLPSDLIGRDRIDPVGLQRGSAEAITWVNGPLFTSVLLADEINRAPSKVQAALLEAMGENQVTPFGKPSRVVLSPIHEAALRVWWELAPGGQEEGHPRGLLGVPAIPPDRRDLAQFTAFATMNPIEQEGTYPLSEAQVDRFCFKVIVPYPRRDVYDEISGVVFSAEAPPRALEPQGTRADYEQYFREHPEALRPILGPIYFFLLCRSFIRPVAIGARRLADKDECLWDANRNTECVNMIYDIVLLTNAKSPSTEGMARRRPIYTEKEQVELRTYINMQEDEKYRHRLLSIFNCRHCQYVLAGASPRGFFKLLGAALCEAFVRGHRMLGDEHILAVIYPVLRHRVHMDVHARLENIESMDVLDAVCDKILEAY